MNFELRFRVAKQKMCLINSQMKNLNANSEFADTGFFPERQG